jgi:hypothetical protein
MSLGVLMMVGAAVMPIGPSAQRFAPYRPDFSNANCGPAGYVAFHVPNTDCGAAAAKRLEASTPIGVLVLALGMAMFAGNTEARGSRVVVGTSARPTGRVRGRSRGSKRYMPG